ncbi:MAG: TonB-dependent receptor domain-containing protein [Spirosomataceae bacterium]
MNTPIRLTAILMLLTGALMAQNKIKGKVVEKNAQPAAYSTISLHLAKDSSIVKGALADENGLYEVLNIASGSYFVSVSYIGFQKYNTSVFSVEDAKPLLEIPPIQLVEDSKVLDEVTVKAQRKLIEQKADRLVLNVENSVITKGNKVNDLLKYTPMVQVRGDGSIKVANKNSVLILVDGKQTGAASLDNFLKNYSAEEILKVEVITNPSAKYDASFGAVINIVTKKSLQLGMNGRFSVAHSQGDYGRFTPDFSLNYRTEKWNVFGNASAGIADYFIDQKIDRFFPQTTIGNYFTSLDSYKYLSLFSGVDFTPNKNHTFGLRLNGNLNNQRNETNTQTPFKRINSQTLDSLFRTQNIGRNINDTYDVNFSYTGKLDSLGREININLTQTFYTKDSRQDIVYYRYGLNNEVSGPPQNIRILNPSNQGNFIAQIDYGIPTAKARWDIGAKYFSIGNDNILTQENLVNGTYVLDNQFSNSGVYKENTYAAYVNYGGKLSKKWNIQVGLRAEKTDQELTTNNLKRDYFGLFPSVNLNTELKSGAGLGLSFSRKVSRPGLNSLVPYRMIVDPYSIMEGNPNLKPQFSNSFDTYYNKGNVTLFANYTYTQDYITDILRGDAQTKVYTQFTGNLKNVHDAYVGINWSHNITKWWQTNSNLSVSGTYTRSPIADVSELRVNGLGTVVSTTNIFSLPKSWKGELSLNYNSPNRWTIWRMRSIYWASISFTKDVWKTGNIRISAEDIFRTQINRLYVSYGVIDLTSRGYNDTQRLKVSFSYGFGKKTVKQARYKSLGNESEKGRMGGGK